MGSLPSGISGSRAAAIVGLSRYRTPVEVWLDIMDERQPGFCASHGYEREEFTGSASTRWGTAFEQSIVYLAGVCRGEEIVDCEREFTATVAPFSENGGPVIFHHPLGAKLEGGGPLTCHLDGVYGPSQVIHEGKTTTSFAFRDSWGEPGSDRIPQEYQVQVQHQMLVSGLKRAVVSVLVFPERPDAWEETGLGVAYTTCSWTITRAGFVVAFCSDWARTLSQMGFFHQYEIAADPVTQSALLDVYRDFWAVNVLGEQPPTPTQFADVKRLFTAPKGTIVADERMERECAEYRLINDELAAMAKRKDQIRTSLVGSMARIAAAGGATLDDESTDKWVVRGPSGKKLAQYGRSKRGGMEFR